MKRCLIVVLLVVLQYASGLDNGLALTPPMGWLAWERFRCNIDCDNDPDNCISENLFMKMADLMVSEGYRDAGYTLLSLDDCWLANERDENGKLQPDPVRFPSGIKALADYVHARGLLFGIYEDYGNYTCAGYPGILPNMKVDADTFAEWTVDYVKLDGCWSEPETMDKGYTDFGRYLNETGRPMIYSCSWPVYQFYDGIEPNYELIAETCNLWRNYGDIQDAWHSVTAITDFYATMQDNYPLHHGPGHWNDPDMLIVGNFGLSYEQSKAQMAIWSVMGAPLLISVDLRTIWPEFKAILQNELAIRINQDSLGKMGLMINKNNNIETWAKEILPKVNRNPSWGIAFVSRRTDGTPTNVTFKLSELGLDMGAPGGYLITDVYNPETEWGVYQSEDTITVSVYPTGAVFLHFEAQG